MASKQSDSSKSKKTPLHQVTIDKSSPGSAHDDVKFTKKLSPTISFPVSDLSLKTSPRVKDLFSSRREKTPNKASKSKSPCRNQGDVMKNEQGTNSGTGNSGDKEAEDGDVELINKSDDFLKLPRRALIRCSNDWEDTIPVATLAMCDNVMPECDSDKESLEEAPKSINEIFNHIIQCLVINKGTTPLKCSTSMPKCFGAMDCAMDKNLNHKNNVNITSDDEDDDNGMNSPTGVHWDIGNGFTNIQTPSHSSGFSEHVVQHFTNENFVDEPLDFDPIEMASEESTPGKGNDLTAPIHSAFRRAREITKKAILTVRSRSPTPQSVREAFGNVVQTGKAVMQRSKDAIVAASCIVPDSDDEDMFLSGPENFELGYLSEILDEDKLITEESKAESDNKKNAVTLGNLDSESPSRLMITEELKSPKTHEFTTGSNQDKYFQIDNTIVLPCPDLNIAGKGVEHQCRSQEKTIFTSNEIVDTQINEINMKDITKHDIAENLESLIGEVNDTRNRGGNNEDDESHKHSYKIQSLHNIEQMEFHVAETSENKAAKCDEVMTEHDSQREIDRSVTDLKFPFNDEDKIIIFKSSMSDVPFEEVTESDDMPRKTISLMTSNEADQDRDITEVIALISDEVSLKRYASVHDLTELQKEAERSTSLSFTSNGKNRRMKLNDRVLESGKLFMKEPKDSQDNIIAGCENDSYNGDAEIENKQNIVNVLDPSYDTDDDQRSSDLSSGEDMSTHSSSQKKTTSSSLTTPPNSPRVGIQTDAVATIISLFETTSILCNSASYEEDLARHADYRTLDNDVSDSMINKVIEDCFENDIINGNGCKDAGVGEAVVENSCGDVDEILDCWREDVQCKNNTDKPEDTDERSLVFDIEKLVAALPSPPNTDTHESLALEVEDKTSCNATTSFDCARTDCKSDLDLTLLRKAFFKDVNVAEEDDVFQARCSPQSAKVENVEASETSPIVVKDDESCGKHIAGNIKNTDSEPPIKFGVKCKNTKAPNQHKNDKALIYQEPAILCPINSKTGRFSPCIKEIVDLSVNEIGRSLDNCDVKEMNNESKSVSTDTGENIEITSDALEEHVEKLKASIDFDSRQDTNNDLRGKEMCNHVTTGELPIVNDTQEVGKTIGYNPHKNLDTPESSSNVQVKRTVADNASKSESMNKLTKELLEENLEMNLEKPQTHVTVNSKKGNPDMRTDISETDCKPNFVFTNNEVEIGIQIEESADESSVETLESDSYAGANQGNHSVIPEVEIYKKPHFIDNGACSSYSSVLETSQTSVHSETICPIFVPKIVTPNSKRPTRPAKITWDLERKSSEKEATSSLSLSEEGEEKEAEVHEEELNRDLDTYNRCNSCQPKHPNTCHQNLEQEEDRAKTRINDDVFVGNSSKMAQFILYTGALFPVEAINTKCIESILPDRPRNGIIKNIAQDTDTSKNIFQNDKQKLLEVKRCTGNGDDILHHRCQMNENVNSDRIECSRAEDGDKRAISLKDGPSAAHEIPRMEMSPIISPLTKPNKNVKKTKLSRSICSLPIHKSCSLDSATQMSQTIWNNKYNNMSQIVLNRQTPSSRLNQSCFPSQRTPETTNSVPSIFQMSKTFETTCNFLDRMSDRIESNLTGIHKTCRFIDRAQTHLNRCDKLIGRSSATLQKSAQMSAKVRDQVHRVELFLASEKLDSPHRTMRK